MKEKHLVICDDDKEYVSRLGRYIGKNVGKRVHLACFSDREQLKRYVGETEADIFLAGKNWVSEQVCPDRRRWIILSEEEAGAAGDTVGNERWETIETEKDKTMLGYLRISRYQSADRILARVMKQLELPVGGRNAVGARCTLIGVYAPGGWADVCALALAMTACLAREGSVVYVGVGEFSPVLRLVEKVKGNDLSDVAYCWRRGRLTDEQLERMAIHLDGFDCIPAPINPAELAELTGQELEQLLEELCNVGGYQTVLVDFGGSISGRLTLFEACRKPFVFFPDTESGRLQQEEFVQFWKSVGADELLQRTEYGILPLEELRFAGKGKREGYVHELAERLLRGKSEDDQGRGIVVHRGD